MALREYLAYARGGKLDPPELTAEGFLPTGDLLMADGDGTVTIMGREKGGPTSHDRAERGWLDRA
mgnify:CR=1 FL=1